MKIVIRFSHIICRVCGMAWKETQTGGPWKEPRHHSQCPRCGVFPSEQDVMKESEEVYDR